MRLVLLSLLTLLITACGPEVEKNAADTPGKKDELVFTPPPPKELNLSAGHVDFSDKFVPASKNDCKARFSTTFDQIDVTSDPKTATPFLTLQLEPHSMVVNLPSFTASTLGLDPKIADQCNSLYEVFLPYVFLDKTGPGIGKKLKNDVKLSIRFERESEFRKLTPGQKLDVKPMSLDLKVTHQIIDGGENRRVTALIRSSTLAGTLTCNGSFSVSCPKNRHNVCTTFSITPPKEACTVKFAPSTIPVGSGKEVKGTFAGTVDFSVYQDLKRVSMHIDSVEF